MPNAIQVADRFHLLKNLKETLEKAFHGKSKAIKSVEQVQLQAVGMALPELPKLKTSHQQQREEKRGSFSDLNRSWRHWANGLRFQGHRSPPPSSNTPSLD